MNHALVEKRRVSWRLFILVLSALIATLFLFFLLPHVSLAQTPATEAPSVTVSLGAGSSERFSVAIQILILLTVLSLAPAIFIMMSSFTRIIVVLSFMRQAFGTQQSPPNQVLIGLALFLTFLVMAPVWQQVNTEALQPYLDEKISQEDALDLAMSPVRNFMLRQVREKDLSLFVKLAKLPQPKNPSDLPIFTIIPAFMISELRTAFQIGFLVYLPFLVIDIVVASILMSMGMMMLPPVMISLPFKLILFVLADGWYLVVGSLVKGFA
ncbi:Flagellar biosynthesis protein FliP [hydrothermal vent metagenome]|uniref:Flagellar biosynthetic protein FliP n=1 Tax=hydrothermal vent metagenome TaxID=652676 RepID=A0A3B1CQ40_9ZZZZ|nr:flagellar type III secretion system pore protein FliP [Candidatus Manganitrophaceae bacterium]